MTPINNLREFIKNIDEKELINRRLKNPTAKMKLVERIALLVGCIQLGEEMVERIHSSQAKNPIIFLGNTGSGKSTLVNYLAGCQMTRVRARDLGLQILGGKAVIVKQDSNPPEVMKIGHSRISQTFVPEVAVYENRAYCDCPGFLDNRGVEINIANIINTRRVVLASDSTRIVMLANYYSLKADRARGLKETIKISQQIFGGADKLAKIKESFLFGVTQVPLQDPDDSQIELEELNSYVGQTEGAGYTVEESEIVDVFSKQLFIYDPCDAGNRVEYAGSLNRQELLSKIDSLAVIGNNEDVFNVSLTSEDAQGLQEICTGMKDLIDQYLKLHNYEDANLLLTYSYKIKLIEHPIAERFVSDCKQSVVAHFKGVVSELVEQLASSPRNLSERAKELLRILTDGIGCFSDEDAAQIKKESGYENAILLAENHTRSLQFFEQDEKIKQKATKFVRECINFKMNEAKKLLQEIKSTVENLNKKYEDLELKSGVDVTDLENQLLASEKRKAEVDKKEEEFAKEKQKMAKNLEDLRTASAAQRKQLLDDIQKQQSNIDRLQGQIEGLKAANRGGGGCIII